MHIVVFSPSFHHKDNIYTIVKYLLHGLYTVSLYMWVQIIDTEIVPQI